MFRVRTVIVFLVWVFCLASCTPRAVREAQEVVAQADSLRAEGMIYGIDAGDSLALAQAYETLGRTSRYLLPITNRQSQITNTYAHSCYHYGRLLREKDDPVGAMECFINATHSRTRDYHILGRVYSNMGDLCHQASEFALSYKMFEHSADMFMKNGDSLFHNYCLNSMAFEQALLGNYDQVSAILCSIESNSNDSYLIAKINETKAESYLRKHQYDSAIYYARTLCTASNQGATGMLICAQAYSYKGEKDSATYYANMVLQHSDLLEDANNALYILTNDDSKKDIQTVRQIASTRADIQKILEVQQGKLSQAVQLLELNLNRKMNLNWLYAIIATVIAISLLISIYYFRQKHKHTLLAQKVQDLTRNYIDFQTSKIANIEHICEMFNITNINKEWNWKDYSMMCEIVDSRFYMLATKLQQKQVLNEQEIRLCILVLLNLTRSQIADVLPYSLNGIGKFKYRVAQKLGTNGKNLRKYIIDTAIDEPI